MVGVGADAAGITGEIGKKKSVPEVNSTVRQKPTEGYPLVLYHRLGAASTLFADGANHIFRGGEAEHHSLPREVAEAVTSTSAGIVTDSGLSLLI